MKARHKRKGYIATVQEVNPTAVSPAEFIAVFEDGSMSSEYCRDYAPIDFTWEDLFWKEI